jgi:hypothetical protein
VGKVVAITNKAVVIADTANPAGGFTDAEYQSIGVTFDTLVDPVDRAAFGAPSDIDNNGRVLIFFTRAVNEITTSGASGVVLFSTTAISSQGDVGDGTCPEATSCRIFCHPCRMSCHQRQQTHEGVRGDRGQRHRVPRVSAFDQRVTTALRERRR